MWLCACKSCQATSGTFTVTILSHASADDTSQKTEALRFDDTSRILETRLERLAAIERVHVSCDGAAAHIISNLTTAFPAVAYATAHGFENGDMVKLAAIRGMREVNGQIYEVRI